MFFRTLERISSSTFFQETFIKNTEEDVQHQISNKLGFTPMYLESTIDRPEIFFGLSSLMTNGYLQNRLSSLFKEKLLFLISRQCTHTYPMTWHASNLYQLGLSTDEILEIKNFPTLTFFELEKRLQDLKGLQHWPQENSNEETTVLLACVAVYEGLQKHKLFALLRSILTQLDFEALLMLLTYARSLLDWYEAHPELNGDLHNPRVHDQINNLFDREPRFRSFFEKPIIPHSRESAEKKYLRLFNKTPIGLCIFRCEDLSIERANEQYLNFFNPDELPVKILEALKQVANGSTPNFNRELQIEVSKQEKHDFFQMTFQPLFDDQQQMTHILQVAINVTDMMTGKNELTHHLEDLSKLADSMPQIIFKANAHGKVFYLNSRWLEYSGSNNPDDWENFVHPEDNGRVTALWKNSVYSGKPFEAEFRLRKLNGIYQWHLSRAVPDKNPKGEIIQWFGTCTNIEEQKNFAHRIFTANKMIENEKQKFESLFREAPAAMAILKGPTLIFEKINAVYLKFLGDRDVLGKPLLEAIPELSGQPFVDIIGEVFKTGVTFSSKEALMMLKSPDQTDENLNSRYFDITYQRMDGPDGTPYGVFVFATDVSEKVFSRHNIQESEKEFRTLAEVMPQIIFTANPNGDITYFNEKWEQYTGYTFEQTKGWSWSPVHHPEDLDRVITRWNESLTTGKPYQIEYRLKGKDGQYRWFLGRALPIKDDLGRIIKWIGTNTDIHEQKILSHKLETALDQVQYAQRLAESANEAKSAFLANMSHEIRTPLGAIMGFVGLMKNPHVRKEDLQKYISITQRNSEQLLKIIDDILDLSKVEAGKLAIEKVNTNLEELLIDFNSSMELKAVENGIQFEIEAANAIPVNILSDPTRLKQILMNIVGNAIKFTHKGSVHMSVSYADSMLEITVKDTGVGIDSAQAKQLFQPFSQADASTTRKYGGTGLGLILTQRLCEAMGGKFILKHSEIGVGSTFVATLKVSVPADTKFFSDFKPTIESDIEQNIDKTALAGVKILVIDDLEDNLTLLNVLLSEAGASVVTEEDAFEGIRQAIERKFDIILMDIQMPLMNGYEVMKKIKRAGSNVPIIALTAHAMKDERERALKNGFSDFLAKPLNPEVLVNTISRLHKQSTYVPPPTEKILIVEDDHDLRDLLDVLLTSKGLDVTLMETGEALLNYLATHEPPKLILVDLALPFMSGNELIPILNKRTDRGQYKVVIASGWDDLPSRAKILKADGYLKKPYNPQTIADSIKKLIPNEATLIK